MSDDEPPPPPQGGVPIILWIALAVILVLGFIAAVGVVGRG